MPGIVVNEPLNPTNWEPEQQRAVYDALVDILEIPPAGTPPADMTDDELQAALIAITAEMVVRGTSSAATATAWQGNYLFAPVANA